MPVEKKSICKDTYNNYGVQWLKKNYGVQESTIIIDIKFQSQSIVKLSTKKINLIIYNNFTKFKYDYFS